MNVHILFISLYVSEPFVIESPIDPFGDFEHSSHGGKQ
jgi:hypothetical protein